MFHLSSITVAGNFRYQAFPGSLCLSIFGGKARSRILQECFYPRNRFPTLRYPPGRTAMGRSLADRPKDFPRHPEIIRKRKFRLNRFEPGR